MPFLYGGKFLLPSQIFLRLRTILPDSANFGAGVLVRAVTTSLVTLGVYTFMYFAQMTAEVEFGAFRTAPHTINALRCDMIGMIHLAPFLGTSTRILSSFFIVAMRASQVSQLMPQHAIILFMVLI